MEKDERITRRCDAAGGTRCWWLDRLKGEESEARWKRWDSVNVMQFPFGGGGDKVSRAAGTGGH